MHARGQSGIATLPGVDIREGIADFYVVHPDLELGYDSPIWAPGMQPVVMRLAAGVAHRGIVVDHEGLPVAGAAVGQSFVHRGPWTLSKADGTFVVSGLDSRTDLAVIHGNRKVIFACMGTDGLRLQLPKPNGESTVVVEASEQAYARDAARTEQRKELVEQREAAWPKVVVRTVGMPADGSVSLVTKHKHYVLDDAIALGKPVPLPDEEFVFLLRGDYDCERFVPGNREQAMRDGVVRLRWFADTILEGRIVDRDGEPVRASVRIETLLSNPDGFEPVTQEVAGALSLPTVLEGLHFLVIRERLTGAVRKLPIDIPRRGDDVVLDLGDLCLRERSQLTVLAPDGSAFTKGEVLMRRLGFSDWAFEFANEQWWGPDLLAGDCLMLAAELAPPPDLAGVRVVDVASRFRVAGEGPWTFQQHGGELLLEIDADGANCGATVGEHYVDLTKPTLLRGLQPGMHQVSVSGVGRRSAIVEIEVPGQGKGRAQLKMALPPRQE